MAADVSRLDPGLNRADLRQLLRSWLEGLHFPLERRRFVWLNLRPLVVGYPSGQRGQTVNLLAYAFDGSNPSPTTIS